MTLRPQTSQPSCEDRELRNILHSPLCCIPEETLLDICRWLGQEDEERGHIRGINGASAKAFSYTKLLTFMSVCRRIRTSASNLPGLWTRITLRSNPSLQQRQWLQLCLERAQLHPLDIATVAEFDTDHISITKQLPRYAARTRTLRVLMSHVSLGACQDYHDLFIASQWPQLECLVCSPYLFQSFIQDSQWVAFDATSLLNLRYLQIQPESLWHLDNLPYLPQLSHLRAHGLCVYNNEHPNPSGITLTVNSGLEVLELYDCRTSPTRAMTDYLAGVLTFTPHLRSLTLSDTHNIPDDVESHDSNLVWYAATGDTMGSYNGPEAHLPNLRELRIAGNLFFTAAALSFLPTPLEYAEVCAGHSEMVTEAMLLASAFILKKARATMSQSTEMIQYIMSFKLSGASLLSMSHISIKPYMSLQGKPGSAVLRLHIAHPGVDHHLSNAIDFADMIGSLRIERLVVIKWDSYWKDEKEPGRVVALELCLWELLWRGSPVEVFEVDSIPQVMNRLEERLVEDGLVGRVSYNG